MKNPTIATLLNIIPGLGYLYLGSRRLFGTLILIGTIFSCVSMSFNPLLAEYFAADYNMWDYIGAVSSCLLIAAFMYDAYHEATRLNTSKSTKK